MLRPLFVAGAMVCTVATAFAGDPVGTYALSGHSPGGADYAGIVTVKATKQTYSVVWSFPGANLTYTGTGPTAVDTLTLQPNFGTYNNSNSNYTYTPRQVQLAVRLHF